MTKLEWRMAKECRSPNDELSVIQSPTPFGFRHLCEFVFVSISG
jgi:hypothetical protein